MGGGAKRQSTKRTPGKMPGQVERGMQRTPRPPRATPTAPGRAVVLRRSMAGKREDEQGAVRGRPTAVLGAAGPCLWRPVHPSLQRCTCHWRLSEALLEAGIRRCH